MSLDKLDIGRLTTSNWLKETGTLSSPALSKIVDLILRPDLSNADVEQGFKLGTTDNSPVYEVREAGRLVRDISIQDYDGRPVDFFLTYKITTTSLSAPLDIITTPRIFTITVDDPTGAAPGICVELWEGDNFYQGEILSVLGNDISLYLPIGLPFTTNATVYICDANMATALERDYTFYPGAANTRDYHITRFIVQMTHADPGDDSRFGDIAGGLANGIYFGGHGQVQGVDIFNMVYNFRTNGDFKARAYDVSYSDRASSTPGNQYGTSVRKTFNGMDKSGVVIPVKKAEDNYIIGHTRDAALADLSSLRIAMTGHQTSKDYEL